jgi:hypothetical protein
VSVDRNEINCPRAKTWMTPCIARDGHTALDGARCVGCGMKAVEALNNLSKRYEPARRYVQTEDPDTAADRLTEMVAAYVVSIM